MNIVDENNTPMAINTAPLFPNKGKKWLKAEDNQLLDEIKQNMTYKAIAANHGRTVVSINYRIKDIANGMYKEGKNISEISAATHLTEKELNVYFNEKNKTKETKMKEAEAKIMSELNELNNADNSQVNQVNQVNYDNSFVQINDMLKDNKVETFNKMSEIEKNINMINDNMKMITNTVVETVKTIGMINDNVNIIIGNINTLNKNVIDITKNISTLLDRNDKI